MFVSISTTGTAENPASDLGFLLHKHPDRVQQFATAHGTAHVFYPESGAQSCTAALLLEVDPAALLRQGRGKGRSGSPDLALAQYVNDRPYAASSLLAVALRTVYRSAMKGECAHRPELPGRALPLRIALPAVPVAGAGDPALVERLFAPLGWQVDARPVPLDESFPEWGDSRYVRLELTGTLRLADALQHLYVLLPVLDGAKHYWVAPDEVDKLLAAGHGWLADHPERALITRRYLARRWSLTKLAMERLALARLAEADDREAEEIDNAVPDVPDVPDAPQAPQASEVPDAPEAPDAAATADTAGAAEMTAVDPADPAGPLTAPAAPAAVTERGESLAVQRRTAILAALARTGAARVLDLGCGQGELVGALLKEPRVTEVLGVDVSSRALTIAARRLHLDRMPERLARRVKLVQGALTYTDARLKGYDAAVLCEVIEHLDLPRLPALEYAVFGAARPATVVVTTPNAEYNVRWETLPAGRMRHDDHRFEWSRAEFAAWAERVAADYGYGVELEPVGPVDPEVGAPTQLAHFRLAEPDPTAATTTSTALAADTATATATDVPSNDLAPEGSAHR
ncbi:3' terminal RNA ribose 2'-O-methyltransferase Hen1 [Kitasatospora phosalacinea]|uniref:Small RNA 2'-O-methyltransferase n=1 Tax=Kitasatospora phosalacinea TaxID=2065 RepID=A0A9W6V3F8_9ACTN|nr:3' terminal RNA ribose 2'-O-methyltransferase Hen1 [Kitasatospora phosalacinea]GLW72168.1 3' terminal RNA ribose 2'-O-methyltransferase Hen1 [Kitasatospora phosalacinea]